MVRPTPVCRRQADPLMVQKLWAAITFIRSQKQVANMDRIERYVQREYSVAADEVERQLNYAVTDRLISIYRAVANKGNNAGAEQDGYRIQPADENERMGDHDWYCYDCHRPGSVLECSECWRVFHTTCIDDDSELESDDAFVCAVCKDVKKQSRVKRKELNKLLGYTVRHLKDKLRELPWFRGQDVGLERFVYHYVDFETMEAKTTSRKYKYLEQFYADARTILHNVFVCFGDSGAVPDLARLMIRDCRYDLDEIRQCKDCYYHSNARMKDWFCQPCRPPHDLVYAKQKGFSYWPAKVIKITPEGYDVRFFGGLHQRALIPGTSIKPLDTNLKTLSLKRTVGFVKATKELARHQELMQHVSATTQETEDNDNLSGGDNDIDDEQDKPETKLVIEKRTKGHHKKNNKRRRNDEAGSLEDSYVVTSSEDKVRGSRSPLLSDARIQTSRKLFVAGGPHKGTQTEASLFGTSCSANSTASSLQPDGILPQCNCDAKMVFNELKDQLQQEHDADKDDALKSLEERLRKDFEDDKQNAVTHALTQAQRDVDSARRQTEDRCKEELAEELKKVVQKHKTEISATKKKQWCYNCEEEAMYHCCWNTSYCSIKCQQEHWHVEHKRMCRRKRN